MGAGAQAALHRVARSWWLRFAVTATILFYLSREIDLRAALAVVSRVRLPHLLVVLVLVALDRAVMIWRWVLLLRASQTPIATSEAARIFLISSFIGSFLPAGVGGDVARTYGLSVRTADPAQAVASVAIDRLLGVLSLALVALLGLTIWPLATATRVLLILGIAAVALVLAAALWADRCLHVLLSSSAKAQRFGATLLTVGSAIARYRAASGVLASVLGWSLIVQLLRIVQAYGLGLGLGLTVPFSYYLLTMPLGLLMLLLPISLSGFGLPQGVIVWLLRPVGVPDELSFALSTLIILTGLAGNLPGLLLWLRPRRTPPRFDTDQLGA